jgi:hypothetical protein
MRHLRALSLTTLAIGTALAVSLAPRPNAAAPDATGADTTTIDDQVDVSLTVYNSNVALVRDARSVQLPPGAFDLKFVDIASTVNPATVRFASLTQPGRVDVLEQNYEYDLLEPEKLLRKYVGRDVTVVRRRQEGGTTRDEVLTAQLVSYNSGPIWRIGDEYVTGLRADELRFPGLPDNLYSRPTLVWSLDNRGASKHTIEASYLAGGLSWNADYVLTVSRDDTQGDLGGWVTLKNASGTAFRRATLHLVAGELNRVRGQLALEADEMAVAKQAMRAAAPMTQEAFSEYHLYTLGRRTSINHNETKQLSLLDAAAIPVEKRFVVDGRAMYYRNRVHPGSPLKDDVQVFYQFRNAAEQGLGLPMPAGVVRVYQSDAKGGLHFVGEDRIEHTPKDETLTVKIGHAFDVVSERKQVDFTRIASDVYETEFEVTLRNHKTTPISVEINEPLGGTWQMLRASHKWTKTDAWAARFDVPVAAEGEATLKYRVRVTY